MTTYNYHIETDSFRTTLPKYIMLGEEGDIVKHNTGRNKEDEFFIPYISGNYIQCIGNVERKFPSSVDEHDRLKTFLQGL